MKVGDLVKLDKSSRKNGPYAGKIGVIVDFDLYDNPVINVEGKVSDFHHTQIAEVINASR